MRWRERQTLLWPMPTDYQSEIVSTNYVIQKIRELDAGQPRLAEAQAMVNKLETAINEISEQLFVLDKAYIKYKSQNYITFTYGSASFLQRLSLKKDPDGVRCRDAGQRMAAPRT